MSQLTCNNIYCKCNNTHYNHKNNSNLSNKKEKTSIDDKMENISSQIDKNIFNNKTDSIKYNSISSINSIDEENNQIRNNIKNLDSCDTYSVISKNEGKNLNKKFKKIVLNKFLEDIDPQIIDNIKKNKNKKLNTTKKMPLALFISSLKLIYGKNIQERIFNLPYFQDLIIKETNKSRNDEQISQKDAYLAILAINSQLTIDDVNHYRADNNISNGVSQSQIIMHLKNPFAILGLNGEKFSLSEKSIKAIDYYPNHYHNLKLIERNQKQSLKDLPLMPYKTTEQLARGIAYTNPGRIPAGKVITKYSESSNKLVSYQLENQINRDGLHAYIYTPVAGEDESEPVILMFRGTKGVNSLSRDLDRGGIGVSGFYRNQNDQILIEMTKNYRNMIVTGHSLGTVDSQYYAITRAAYEKAQNNRENLKMRMMLYCAPKLPKPSYKRSQQLNEHRDPNLDIEIFFADNYKDPVSKAGFANIAHGKLFKVNYYRDYVSHPLYKLKPHTNDMFNNENANVRYKQVRSDSMDVNIAGSENELVSGGQNPEGVFYSASGNEEGIEDRSDRKELTQVSPLLNFFHSLLSNNLTSAFFNQPKG